MVPGHVVQSLSRDRDFARSLVVQRFDGHYRWLDQVFLARAGNDTDAFRSFFYVDPFFAVLMFSVYEMTNMKREGSDDNEEREGSDRIVRLLCSERSQNEVRRVRKG